MQILPVLDLQSGQVVRGIAGQRESYRPVLSRLVSGSEPVEIARALVATFGSTHAYLADLDAIAGGEPAWTTYSELLDCGLSLWIDAGICDVQRARQLATFAPAAGTARGTIRGIIAGLESLPNEELLKSLLDVVGADRLVFSLDLKSGDCLARFDAWKDRSPLEIALAAIRYGVRRMIVLDLAGVGVGGGVPTLGLCRAIRARAPNVELTTGGGVRGIDDLVEIAGSGCNAALVASAIHDGSITPAAWRQAEIPARSASEGGRH